MDGWVVGLVAWLRVFQCVPDHGVVPDHGLKLLCASWLGIARSTCTDARTLQLGLGVVVHPRPSLMADDYDCVELSQHPHVCACGAWCICIA